MASQDNLNLNLNSARQDKFFLRFGKIPSIDLLTPKEAGELQKISLGQDDKDFFHIALKTAQIPGVSLGEVKTPSMFVPIADTDMNYTFESLSTTMKMDPDYILYKMLILWMYMIKHPETASQFGMKETYDLTSINAILTMVNNFGDPIMSFEFFGIRPLSLPTIDLDYATEGQEITMPITWSYTYFLPKTGNGDDFSTDVTT
jgi:hypothetical protein